MISAGPSDQCNFVEDAFGFSRNRFVLRIFALFKLYAFTLEALLINGFQPGFLFVVQLYLIPETEVFLQCLANGFPGYLVLGFLTQFIDDGRESAFTYFLVFQSLEIQFVGACTQNETAGLVVSRDDDQCFVRMLGICLLYTSPSPRDS